jgi:hypothetical protein
LVVATSGLAQQPGQPAETADTLTEEAVIEEVTTRIDRAMEYLYSQQRPDGSWVPNNQAANALATLSFLGRGHVPGRGPYRDVLEKSKRFLLSVQNKDTGFIATTSMYEHGLATLALSELYGMDPDPLLEASLRKAVDLIVQCQSPAGGWRYSPAPTDQDLSVSVMQIVALRAANNAEIPVPQATIDRAIAYVRSCAAPTGGYGYQGPGSGPQTSAAGLLSLQLLGQYEDPTISPTLDYLATIPIDWSNQTGVNYFYYFHYYAMQGHYQAGGKRWNDWHPRIRELLFTRQQEDGSWTVPDGTAEQEGTVGPNRIYWTAMASLVLEVYMHFLPAYQR